MDVRRTVPLRIIARRLPKVLNRRARTATGDLLSLLRSGELKAGFDFPGRVKRWISIPASYWAGIGSDQFRTLHYEKGNKHKPGTFKVRISQFADEFVQAVSSDLENGSRETASLLDELKGALSAASRRYEVVITEQEWKSYLQKHNLSEPPDLNPKAGRHQLPAWRDIAIVIGAYLIKHHATEKEKPLKIEEAAKKIHDIAKNKEISGMPAWTTIKDILSQMRSTSDTLSIN
jgi:hypothetical protein